MWRRPSAGKGGMGNGKKNPSNANRQQQKEKLIGKEGRDSWCEVILSFASFLIYVFPFLGESETGRVEREEKIVIDSPLDQRNSFLSRRIFYSINK
jgi:hypothetical protein